LLDLFGSQISQALLAIFVVYQQNPIHQALLDELGGNKFGAFIEENALLVSNLDV